MSDLVSSGCDGKAVLSVQKLETSFPTRLGDIKAVDRISFEVRSGKVLGLVGESGSGKSVTGYSIIGLVEPPGAITGGRVIFKGRDITRLKSNEMRQLRGREIAMIFQDPMMTLNPVLSIATQMVEAVQAHQKVSRAQARAQARDALGQVGIANPEERLDAYPHQFSGGMRQRVAIAIALLHKPALLIADEPTTALDVTIQSQILAEVQQLIAQTGTAVIWITHDLTVVSRLADDIAVMYAGKIVEYGPAVEVIRMPLHRYTEGLVNCVPSRNVGSRRIAQIPGTTPSLLNLPSGCAFHFRCAHADSACGTAPSEIAIGDRRHRCFHPSHGSK
jgi:peptide/nickel transport system ATP-binding protein